MPIIIAAATEAETAEAARWSVQNKLSELDFHTIGVGQLSASYALLKRITGKKPDLVILAGIAGCFDKTLPLSQVVAIQNDIDGNSGVAENGKWLSLADTGFRNGREKPFQNGLLPNPWLKKYNLLHLPTVNAVTVDEISTDPSRIARLRQYYQPVTESMEGAALHYTCLQEGIPFIQIRSLSNYIGERNKENWQLKESISRLNQSLIQYLQLL